MTLLACSLVQALLTESTPSAAIVTSDSFEIAMGSSLSLFLTHILSNTLEHPILVGARERLQFQVSE